MFDFASEFFNWDLFCPAIPHSVRLKVAGAKFFDSPQHKSVLHSELGRYTKVNAHNNLINAHNNLIKGCILNQIMG